MQNHQTNRLVKKINDGKEGLEELKKSYTDIPLLEMTKNHPISWWAEKACKRRLNINDKISIYYYN